MIFSEIMSQVFFVVDFLDLVYPEAIEEARHRIIGALQSYEMGMLFLTFWEDFFVPRNWEK